ncbi:MAG TPA: alpha/beta fold hydrolase [Anaerolineales bacterium]|nr:alpha/beta fold hydrolase [Anaerolineales bacterium]
MQRFVLFILVLSLASLSCQTVYDLVQPVDQRLQELGGVPCEGIDDFICVTIPMPLDHFDPSNSETVDVVFAVAPATGERKGMFVQAFPGGPGGEGIPYASRDYLARSIWRSYDIVFFDQRGVGRSDPLECKTTYANSFVGYLNEDDTLGEEGLDTPQEQQAAIEDARAFVDECIAEIGIDPAKLQFFTTDQVAEDIESFRQAIGDDKFMLYGVSYGTSVAQTYARAHPEHLSGLILDATQDTTLSGEELADSQWEGFNRVLLEVFEACDADPECSSMFEEPAQASYDGLAQRLAKGPIPYEYSLSDGQKVEHIFTLHMLEYTAAYQLYGMETRMDLMRALAAASEGDIVPMADLYFDVAMIDPATGEYEGDPSFSDTMFYIVLCGDDAYFSGTVEERTAQIIEEIQERNGLIPRIDIYPDLTCPYWPHAPANPETREPLKAPGVPTFVLNATLDPATPFPEGKAVFENLENGYHLYVNGGLHSIYGWGYSCPDDYIADFLVNGNLPDQREIVCDWGDAVLGQ